jgi:hypothetical protein
MLRAGKARRIGHYRSEQPYYIVRFTATSSLFLATFGNVPFLFGKSFSHIALIDSLPILPHPASFQAVFESSLWTAR